MNNQLRPMLLSTLVIVLTFASTLSQNLVTAGTSPMFLSVQARAIVDPQGRQVILRGVNYPGYECSPLRSHVEDSYATFARLGFNVVRLPIAWSFIEPWPGRFDKEYMDRYVNRDIIWAKKYGLYVILDMHQWNWAEKFGGCGVPNWAVEGFPPTELGFRQAVSHFWNSSELQYHLAKTWGRLAKMYAGESAIAGFDILNEPWVFSSISNLNATHVDSFYLNVIKEIRNVDAKHIIFLEPANMMSYNFPTLENIVWSPHFYALSFARKYSPDNITLLKADFEAKYKKFVIEMGFPMWIGEFGAFMKDSRSQRLWLEDAIQIFGDHDVGWAWWAYRRGTSLPQPILGMSA